MLGLVDQAPDPVHVLVLDADAIFDVDPGCRRRVVALPRSTSVE
ncbi:MAG: hypothetical protein ABSG36_16650 [Acidimicrobiales bacterium]